MDFNNFDDRGMPVGIFFSNRHQIQMPKTVANVFIHITSKFRSAWECDMCGQRFRMPEDIMCLQGHLDHVHGEESRD